MDITSLICGIVGLLGIVYSFFAINILNEYSMNNSKVFLLLLFIPFLLLLIAIIFGFISRNKKVRKFSLTGRILGYIGIILIIICTIPEMTNNKGHILIYKLRNQIIYSYFNEIGIVGTTTKDNFFVEVKISIAYDLDDPVVSLELLSRKDELRDFIMAYFHNKISSELVPEKEEQIKKDIRAILNTDILRNGKIKFIYFEKLDIGYPY
jgi:flagellar basal body-associated protein FliL